MIPRSIPDDCVPAGCKRITIAPPEGDAGDVLPVEAVVGLDSGDGGMRIAVLVELEDGDLERLQKTPAIWLTFMANHLHPFALHIADGEDWATVAGDARS